MKITSTIIDKGHSRREAVSGLHLGKRTLQASLVPGSWIVSSITDATIQLFTNRHSLLYEAFSLINIPLIIFYSETFDYFKLYSQNTAPRYLFRESSCLDRLPTDLNDQ